MSFFNIFKSTKGNLIGMIHVKALPGTPRYRKELDGISEIIEHAVQQTRMLLRNGFNALLIENMNDIPYTRSNQVGPEIVAAMTRICTEIRKSAPTVPIGVQILAGANRQALAVAKATGLNFIRVEGYVFSHVADEGFTDACAGDLLRYRKQIDAENVAIFADIKKKHSSHAITQDVSLMETAKAAEFFDADGVILTGASTGDPVDLEELSEILRHIRIPVLIGSGVTEDNLKQYIESNALIVGSHLKKDGNWKNDIDEQRVQRFVHKLNSYLIK